MVLGIYGTGGSGRELYHMIHCFDALSKRWDKIYFIDANKQKKLQGK